VQFDAEWRSARGRDRRSSLIPNGFGPYGLELVGLNQREFEFWIRFDLFERRQRLDGEPRGAGFSNPVREVHPTAGENFDLSQFPPSVIQLAVQEHRIIGS
jgi:hypothetical protein